MPESRGGGQSAGKRKSRKKGFLAQHCPSIACVGVLILWVVLYSSADPNTHWGSFVGNAIADWSGVVVTVLATKYLYEQGSPDCRRLHGTVANPFLERMREH